MKRITLPIVALALGLSIAHAWSRTFAVSYPARVGNAVVVGALYEGAYDTHTTSCPLLVAGEHRHLFQQRRPVRLPLYAIKHPVVPAKAGIQTSFTQRWHGSPPARG